MKIEAIQMLRGWAILIVIVTRLSVSADMLKYFELPTAFDKGWIGVELFFIVISGFVVSTSLRNSSFNLKHFYWQRLFRLLSALPLVMLVATPTLYFIFEKWRGSAFAILNWNMYWFDN